MAIYQIRKGKNLRIKGAACPDVLDRALPAQVGLYPTQFKGLKPRVLVKQGDAVQVGQAMIENKQDPRIVIPSPVSGKVHSVRRGERRALLDIILETDGQQKAIQHAALTDIHDLSREDLIAHMLKLGVWPYLRQRPFSGLADPNSNPKSIFVQAMNTEPLAPDVDVLLAGQENIFQFGLNLLARLTSGVVNLCFSPRSQSTALLQAENCVSHQFAGPHPAGNVSTHIHLIDPINKGDVVWYITAQDLLTVAHSVQTGQFCPQRTVALTGEGIPAKQRCYVKTIIGAPLEHVLDTEPASNARYLSGSILSGHIIHAPQDLSQQELHPSPPHPEIPLETSLVHQAGAYLDWYGQQIHALPDQSPRIFLRFMRPGLKEFTLSRTYIGGPLQANREVSLNTSLNGSLRAIVANDVYDKYVPLDIYTFFLLKAAVFGDLDEAERLGILECDEEDFALCTFACPSKVDVGGIIRSCLDQIEKEG